MPSDFRHREAIRRSVEADLDIGQPAASAANQLTKLEAAAVIGFATHRAGRARLCFDEPEMVEKIVVGTTMAVAAVATATPTFPLRR